MIKVLLCDYNVAIGSTTDTVPLMKNIEKTELNNIPNTFTSESLRVYKPEKMFYESILKQTGWNACLLVIRSMMTFKDHKVLGRKRFLLIEKNK